MIVTDVLGNELKKDDLVCVCSGDQQLMGLVMEINEPSLLAPGKDQMRMPGMVRIAYLPTMIPYDVRNSRLTTVIKVVKPPNFQKKES
jgi:hypothetical protein